MKTLTWTSTGYDPIPSVFRYHERARLVRTGGTRDQYHIARAMAAFSVYELEIDEELQLPFLAIYEDGSNEAGFTEYERQMPTHWKHCSYCEKRHAILYRIGDIWYTKAGQQIATDDLNAIRAGDAIFVDYVVDYASYPLEILRQRWPAYLPFRTAKAA